jgi:steroid 5-alpha reductase family enzyme
VIDRMQDLGWRRRWGSCPAARRGARQRAGLTPASASNTLSCLLEMLHSKQLRSIKILVDSNHGIYRFTRNPMYLGLVILTLGIAVWVGAWPMFIAPIAVFATANWVHIPFEEDKMRRQFGATYDGYVRRVRRWV